MADRVAKQGLSDLITGETEDKELSPEDFIFEGLKKDYPDMSDIPDSVLLESIREADFGDVDDDTFRQSLIEAYVPEEMQKKMRHDAYWNKAWSNVGSTIQALPAMARQAKESTKELPGQIWEGLKESVVAGPQAIGMAAGTGAAPEKFGEARERVSETSYTDLLNRGYSPEIARHVMQQRINTMQEMSQEQQEVGELGQEKAIEGAASYISTGVSLGLEAIPGVAALKGTFKGLIRHSIAGAGGFGSYEGLQAALEGKTASEIQDATIKGTLMGSIVGPGLALGGRAIRGVVRKFRGYNSKALGTPIPQTTVNHAVGQVDSFADNFNADWLRTRFSDLPVVTDPQTGLPSTVDPNIVAAVLIRRVLGQEAVENASEAAVAKIADKITRQRQFSGIDPHSIELGGRMGVTTPPPPGAQVPMDPSIQGPMAGVMPPMTPEIALQTTRELGRMEVQSARQQISPITGEAPQPNVIDESAAGSEIEGMQRNRTFRESTRVGGMEIPAPEHPITEVERASPSKISKPQLKENRMPVTKPSPPATTEHGFVKRKGKWVARTKPSKLPYNPPAPNEATKFSKEWFLNTLDDLRSGYIDMPEVVMKKEDYIGKESSELAKHNMAAQRRNKRTTAWHQSVASFAEKVANDFIKDENLKKEILEGAETILKTRDSNVPTTDAEIKFGDELLDKTMNALRNSLLEDEVTKLKTMLERKPPVEGARRSPKKAGRRVGKITRPDREKALYETLSGFAENMDDLNKIESISDIPEGVVSSLTRALGNYPSGKSAKIGLIKYLRIKYGLTLKEGVEKTNDIIKILQKIYSPDKVKSLLGSVINTNSISGTLKASEMPPSAAATIPESFEQKLDKEFGGWSETVRDALIKASTNERPSVLIPRKRGPIRKPKGKLKPGDIEKFYGNQIDSRGFSLAEEIVERQDLGTVEDLRGQASFREPNFLDKIYIDRLGELILADRPEDWAMLRKVGDFELDVPTMKEAAQYAIYRLTKDFDFSVPEATLIVLNKMRKLGERLK